MREQFQTGRPATSQPVNLAHLLDAATTALGSDKPLHEKGLIFGKQQFVRVDGGQTIADPKARKIAWWPSSAGNEQANMFWRLSYRRPQQLAKLGRGKRLLCVVHHQNLQCTQPVVERREKVAEIRSQIRNLHRAKQQKLATGLRRKTARGNFEEMAANNRISVATVHLVPEGPQLSGFEIARNERGFPGPGGLGPHSRMFKAFVQTPIQTLAWMHARETRSAKLRQAW
ncbi:MAG: hypothetical protein IPN78_13820 [Candidatus Accumulibacter sp.]|nr:hypothetical protein [Candidatus Accumulibacter propinquus]